MHKGLYWSQLMTGIGIGLVLASSIWIATENISIADALAIPRVGVDQTQNTSSTTPTGNASDSPLNGAALSGMDSPANVGLANSTGEGVSNQMGNAMPTGTMGTDSPNGSDGLAQNPLQEPAQGAGTEQRMVSNVEQSQTTDQGSTTLSIPYGAQNPGSTDPQVQPTSRGQSGEFKIVYAFVVDPGDSSERIASKLEAYGLTSSNDFLQAIHAQNLDRKLRAGHYELTEGESLNDIIAKLTR